MEFKPPSEADIEGIEARRIEDQEHLLLARTGPLVRLLDAYRRALPILHAVARYAPRAHPDGTVWCDFCGASARAGEAVRHAARCVVPQAAPWRR